MNVEVVDVRKKFDGAGSSALKDVSLVAESGCITSLVGASGCGKTTTLRCIAGLDTIDSGEIRFGDTVVSLAGHSLVPTAQRNVGMVFQSYALWPHLTVVENIAFGLRMRGWSKAQIKTRVAEVLAAINLAEYGDRYPAQLSGGQQQRVAVGRALAYKPMVLLMDEPLANLDTHLRAQMRQEIRRLQRAMRVTMIYVTHDRAEAMELSDRVVIMDQGSVVQVGSPAELFAEPRNVLVARFLGHANFLDAQALGMDAGALVVDTSFGRCQVGARTAATGDLALLVRNDAVHLSGAGEAPPPGWLVARGQVLGTSPAAGGEHLTFSFEGGTLEVFVPEAQRPLIGGEVTLFIDPEKCQVLERAAGHA
jgi:ABC-type sugar transport system ATPase subunit